MKLKNMKIILLSFMALGTFLSIEMFGQVVIQRCDLVTGWEGAQAFTIDNSDMKEGFASVKTSAKTGNSVWFSKIFSSTQTGITESGYLSFWLYVSDAAPLEGGEVIIGSSRGSGDMESKWAFDKNDLSDGWNELNLQIGLANDVNGGVNLDSVNYFAISQNLSSNITVKIDFIRFVQSLEAPTWPLLGNRVVDNTTLDGKVVFGYQGWFNHPDDGAGRGWVHWGNLYEPVNPSIDMWPDFREYGEDELFPSHYTMKDGSRARVYSSFNQNSVQRHMKWIRDYNLDGVFIQRFISGYYNQTDMDHKDSVAVNVMRGCEKYGGVFAMMYDGVANRVEEMKADWIHLVDEIGVTESDRYLHHRGLPMVSLWGYTVRDDATLDQLEEMIDFFVNNPNPKYRASVKLGVAWNWYSKTSWFDSFKQAAVISPWFSGSTDYNLGQKWCDDNNVDYLPVVHPGFSWYNLKDDSPLNKDPRNAGQFLWNEVNDVVKASVKSVYIAMYDEIDEGTAMFKLAEDESMIPREGSWVPLNADGYDLPSDWYLRMASMVSDVVRGNEDNKRSLNDMPEPPEGIMAVRIINEKNNNDQGGMEFIFPDFPAETTIEISIDSGMNFTYSCSDDIGSFVISGLNEGNYPVFVRHGEGSPVVDMGHVRISDVFEGLPGKANDPFPSDGAIDVRTNTALGWKYDSHAVSHHVFFGSSEDPDSITYQLTASYSPGELEANTTYYWKINEENGSGVAEGDIWSFTTSGPGGPSDYVVLDYCDEVTNWKAPNGLELDSELNMEGFACLSSNGASENRFNKAFETPVNSFCDENGFFSLWLYVSDVSVFTNGGQIEVGSGGTNDVDEFNWSTSNLGIENGWNELHLPIKDAGKNGSPDLTSINWFRVYLFASEEIEVKIDFLRFTGLMTTPLSRPQNLSGTVGDGQVMLNWDDNIDATLAGYNVYRSTTSGSAYSKLNSSILTSSEYTDESVTNGTTYYYTVVAVDAEGYESSKSEEVILMPVFIDNERNELKDFNLYPNPASSMGHMQFSIKEKSEVAISIYDMQGRQIHRFIEDQEWPAGDHRVVLPLQGFKAGAYVISIRVNDVLETEILLIE